MRQPVFHFFALPNASKLSSFIEVPFHLLKKDFWCCESFLYVLLCTKLTSSIQFTYVEQLKNLNTSTGYTNSKPGAPIQGRGRELYFPKTPKISKLIVSNLFFSETNLKCRQCDDTTNQFGEDEAALSAFNARIICEPPNSNLSRYDLTKKERKM